MDSRSVQDLAYGYQRIKRMARQPTPRYPKKPNKIHRNGRNENGAKTNCNVCHGRGEIKIIPTFKDRGMPGVAKLGNEKYSRKFRKQMCGCVKHHTGPVEFNPTPRAL